VAAWPGGGLQASANLPLAAPARSDGGPAGGPARDPAGAVAGARR
jgi:hypothetical protein